MRQLCSTFMVLSLVTAVPAQVSPTAQSEQRVVRAFEAAKKAGAPELYAFLKPFPKGADLHVHLSGAVYAETFVDDAIADHLCFDTVTLTLLAPSGTDTCATSQLPAAAALTDQALYNKIVDALSMRDFVPASGFSPHDQFFATFIRFNAIKSTHKGEWLDEVVTRAARQNEQYLELMESPTAGPAFALAPTIHADLANPDNFAAARAAIPQSTIDAAIQQARTYIDITESQRNALEHCGTPQAQPGCSVQIRWIVGVLRDFPPAQLFAQTLLGFELAARDPRVVGVNFLRAEDWHGSLVEYHLGMQMVGYLHSVYPKAHISLHAGELAPGMVPPEDLRFHIREAVELAHAERIGHGVDLFYENRPQELLKEMASKHIDVEINLTSNDGILGIKRSDHPLAAYRAAHVPWSLSTDDEGVSRTDLTHEYVRGALEQNLTYADLKQSARASLDHSFLPGDSLYATPDAFTRRKPECAGPITATSKPSAACSELLNSSARATQQYELERRFAVFENGPF